MVAEYLEYTNSRGASVRFGGGSFCGLVSVEGLGDVGAVIQTQSAPFQHGATFIDALLEQRFISVEFIVRGENYGEVAKRRADIARTLSPLNGLGTLKYVNGGIARDIYAIAEGVPAFPDGEARGERWQRGLLTFVAPSPYWQDVEPTNVKLEDYVSNFSFPFSFPVSFAARGDMRTLINDGHAPAPVKITFRGESINPKITKVDTGEFIRVKRTIPAGYSLVITTGFNDKAVKIVAPDGVITNAMGYIDLGSTFFSLDVGDNRLSFITEGGQPDVYIEYKNLYLGV